ncbi:MAG: ABC transporter substrate-binding protein [Methanobrevibacter sp.]|jgi:NitT/TauT family transport system substrate-binding protein|nr:ABC transporter substrate-binding protein [Candidatus Methanovirga meridionalis]
MGKKKSIAIIAALLILSALGISLIFSSQNSNDNVVNMGYLPSDHDSALFVGQAKKWYEDNNITLNLFEFNNGGSLMVAIASGHIDMGYVGISPVVASISKGIPAKIVSSVQNEGSGIVVSKDSNITSINDLEGKTIATPGAASIQNVLLTYALKKNGLSKNNVSVVDSLISSMVNALRTKKLDAIVPYEPYVTIPVEDGSGVEIASSHDILPDHPCCVIVAREDFIKTKKSTLKTMLDIHENATKFILENTDVAAGFLPDTIVKNVSVEKKSLKNIKFNYGLSDEYINNVMNFIDIEIGLGFIKKPISKEKLFEIIN